MVHRRASPPRSPSCKSGAKPCWRPPAGLIQRIAAANDKRAPIAELDAWADTIVPPGKATAIPTKIAHAIALEKLTLGEELAHLKKLEMALT